MSYTPFILVTNSSSPLSNSLIYLLEVENLTVSNVILFLSIDFFVINVTKMGAKPQLGRIHSLVVLF